MNKNKDKIITELRKEIAEQKDDAKRYETHCKEEKDYDYWCGYNGGVIFILERIIQTIKEDKWMIK
jgi:hypothetical protein